ncbi:MAG: mucin-2 protein [Nocardioides sp.]|nr:mucin-2 protein [Nocardioides sp.]
MADLRHTRDPHARRTIRPALVAAPIALLVTAGALALGVTLQAPDDAEPTARPAAAISAPETPAPVPAPAPERPEVVSRSTARDLAPLMLPAKEPNLMSEVETRRAIRRADTELWTTEVLNLWNRPGENAEEDGEVESSQQVLVTGRELWGRTEIVVGGKPRWVTMGYLSSEKPVETGAGAGLSMAPCPDGGVESGLTDAAVYVYRSVCNAFPQITTYGGYANRGEHASGKAVDIMTSDAALGTAIANFLRANAAELDLYNVIWRQQIFTQERAGEGWRYMPSRGSVTANHFDHVHVAAY